MLPDRVTLEGSVYVKESLAGQVRQPIGIAVTTHNRSDIAHRCVENILLNTPSAYVVVVDDASAQPFECVSDRVAVFRFDEQQGIAKAKNKCLELLMAAGVEHLFLFDDDCWPMTQGWYEKYVNHPEPHLCLLFKDRNQRGQEMEQPRTLYDDSTFYALENPRGCMMYMQRSVVDRVGGYRPEFGVWGYEHVEYSRRVHAACLTSFPFQDVCGSSDLVYSVDANPRAHPGFARSVPEKVRRQENENNRAIYERLVGSSEYVEYRKFGNVVLSVMLTGSIDPQRGKKINPAESQPWQQSIKGADAVLLHDQGTDDQTRVATSLNPYAQRWCSYYQYLRSHPVDWVFCTDCTDVTMLREPWDQMQPGVLYVGWEPKTVAIDWMTTNHPPYRDWIIANANKMLLNPGVVGGDYQTVMEFCHDMTAECVRIDHAKLVGDMAAFNQIAYSDKWVGRLSTGPGVTTLFKHNETVRENKWSWFAHK